MELNQVYDIDCIQGMKQLETESIDMILCDLPYGKSAGALETDISYIKESVQRIETQLNRDVQRLEGRIDEISNQMSIISNTAGRAHESAKSAHNRIDEHLQREHNITVERGRTNET